MLVPNVVVGTTTDDGLRFSATDHAVMSEQVRNGKKLKRKRMDRV